MAPRSAALLALWLAAVPLSARGDPVAAPPVAAPEGPTLTPVWLDLVVNGAPKGTSLALLGAEGEIWIAAEDLARAGLAVEGGERIAEPGGRSMVALRSLAPSLEYSFDEMALAVRIEARQAILGRTVYDLSTLRRPAGLRRRQVPSAYLNWSARSDTLAGESANAELGASAGPALLLTGGTVSETYGAVRGLTTGYWDDERRLVRHAAGDVVASPGDPLGGTAVLLGLGSWREFSLDPYLLRAPYPRRTLFSPTPATLEVWIDDALVRRTQVQPGTIEIENLPINAGVSQVRTVVRDPFGRESSASTFEFLGSTSLAPGLVDWGVTAGFAREAFGVESFQYGRPLAFGRIRAGITQHLTLASRMELGDGLISGGGSATLATPLGELEAIGGASLAEGAEGAAAQVTWRRRGRWGGVSLVGRYRSDRYANASLGPGDDRSTLRGSAILSAGVARGLTLVADVTAERFREAGDYLRAGLRGVWAIGGGRMNLSASATRTFVRDGPSPFSFMVLLGVPLFERVSGSVGGGIGTGGGASYADFTANRPLAPGPGLGFRVAARAGDGDAASADFQAQSGVGRVELNGQLDDPWTGADERYGAAQLSSGLIWMDGRVFVTPPVDGSYALVKLDGAPNVRITRESHVVGRTDAAGELLVTELLPYMGNRIGLRDADLPLEYRVNETERIVAPRYRGGTVERFDVRPVLTVTGRVMLFIEERDVAPEWGEIAVELPTGRVVSPIGTDGAFWLEGLTPGRQEALVRWEGKLCRFTFDVGEKPGILDLGQLRCTQMLAAGGDAEGSPSGG